MRLICQEVRGETSRYLILFKAPIGIPDAIFRFYWDKGDGRDERENRNLNTRCLIRFGKLQLPGITVRIDLDYSVFPEFRQEIINGNLQMPGPFQYSFRIAVTLDGR